MPWVMKAHARQRPHCALLCNGTRCMTLTQACTITGGAGVLDECHSAREGRGQKHFYLYREAKHARGGLAPAGWPACGEALSRHLLQCFTAWPRGRTHQRIWQHVRSTYGPVSAEALPIIHIKCPSPRISAYYRGPLQEAWHYCACLGQVSCCPSSSHGEGLISGLLSGNSCGTSTSQSAGRRGQVRLHCQCRTCLQTFVSVVQAIRD